MHPSFLFVLCALLVVLWTARTWSLRRGQESSAMAWSALAWVVLGMGLSRLLFLDPMEVKGNSMYPALKNSEVVVVDKRATGLRIPIYGWHVGSYSPNIGDIVVFEAPNGENWIKRVAAVPSDRLVYIRERGWFRNGYYLAPILPGPEPNWLSLYGAYPLTSLGEGVWEMLVPADFVFVLGDNVSESIDSRRMGPVSLSRIQGRVK